MIMGLFKSKTEKELDSLIQRMEMNLSNNYKDNAQDNLKDFVAALEYAKDKGNIKGSTLSKYEGILTSYREKLKGYSHKDQKPYWH